MTPRSVRHVLSLAALLMVLATAGVAASQAITTECFSAFPPAQGNAPKWVVAGFSRIQVVDGTQIMSDHFFDGAAGWFPNRLNFVAGASDCDQDPDVRTTWGYTVSDDNTELGALMTINVTAFRVAVAAPPPGCTHTNNPIVMSYLMDTRADAGTLRSESGSLPFKMNLSNCVVGGFTHVRVQAISDTDQQSSVTKSGCFLVSHVAQSSCVGNGPSCL